MPATWFRKTKMSDTPAKEIAPEAAVTVAPFPEASPPTPQDEPMKAEAIAAPPPDKEVVSAAPTPRASRLVEAARKGPTDIASKLGALVAQAEPWGKPAAAAAGLFVVGALGFAGGYGLGGKSPSEDIAALRWSEASATIRENREDVTRLASEMRFVRNAVDSLRSDRRGGDNSAKQAQLIERSAADTSARIGKLSEQLDRIEKTQRDPARLGALVERLERIEKQMHTASLTPAAAAPAPAGPAAAKPVAAAPTPVGTDVATTGSIPADARPPARPIEAVVDPRKQPAEGYTLRDIEDGFALVEGRNGRYFEVSPGMNLPGLGRVEAIERRGRQWVVVTPKGFIAER